MITLIPKYNSSRSTAFVRESAIGNDFDFVLSDTPLAGSLRVFKQGLLKNPITDYNLVGTMISFTEPAVDDTNINFFYQISDTQVPLLQMMHEQKLIAGTEDIVLNYTPYSNLEEVYSVGRLLHPTLDYTKNDNVISLVAPSPANTIIRVIYWIEWS